MNKPSSVNKSPGKSDTRWIVRASNFPFALPGKVLGVVEATDATHARMRALRQFDCATVVEPEHTVNPALERVVAKAVQAQARRARSGRYGHSRPRRKPMTPDGDIA